MTRRKQILFDSKSSSDNVSTHFTDYGNEIGVGQSILADGRIVASDVTLTRAEAEHVVTTLQAWLSETDPAYQAWVAERENDMKFNPDAPATVNPDQLKAYEAMVGPALPATDDEWKARLAEGCKS